VTKATADIDDLFNVGEIIRRENAANAIRAKVRYGSAEFLHLIGVGGQIFEEFRAKLIPGLGSACVQPFG
jgi:hypothetical protein